jgi:hypothetical protein
VECWMQPIGESNPEIHQPRTGSFHQVSAFEYSACAITTSGDVDCWDWPSPRIDPVCRPEDPRPGP